MLSHKKAELLTFFFAEVSEQIELLEQDILRLESNPEDKEIIQTIFRYAHSIKGSSASMGFEQLKVLTHQMEYVLDLIRKEKLTATPEVIDVLFVCLDGLRALKDNYEKETEVADIAPIIHQLKRLTEQPPEQEQVGAIKVNAMQTKAVQEALQQGEDIWVGDVTFAPSCATKKIRVHIVQKEMAKIGVILHVDVNRLEEKEVHKAFYYIKKQADVLDEIRERIKKIVDIEGVLFHRLKKEEQTPPPVQTPPKKPSPPTIRVDVNKIENLMNLVGEIIIDQTMVTQMNTELRQVYHANEQVTEQERVLKHMSRVISEFQEHVMKIRMLPIEQLFSRFPRVVRDLSGQLGKDIRLVLEGGETELDRTVIEELSDPLIHIIRNSIDHGIEPNDNRVENGKARQGTITVSATHKENQVVLVVEDDGAGIDPEKIKDSAVKKGVISPSQAEKMTDHELVHLVFAAGFSTSTVVSDVSGRGVGMDVVRNHIEKLNGMVEIQSKKGKGTKMIIKLPLTLAILKGFLIEVNDRTLAIPMNSVNEIFTIHPREVQRVNGQTMVKIREHSLPLFWASDMFGWETKGEEKERLVVMMIGIAEKRIGMIVDQLIGNQEIVIKSMGSYVGKIPAVSGSTILGDGRVALILDVADIFKRFSERKGGEHR